MTKAIGPGMCVRCIGTGQNAVLNFATAQLTLGAIYFVEEVYSIDDTIDAGSVCPVDGCTGGYLMLKDKSCEIPAHHRRHGFMNVRIVYCASQFTPLDDGDVSMVKDEETGLDVRSPETVGC